MRIRIAIIGILSVSHCLLYSAEPLKVSLDCKNCDKDYIFRSVPYVEFVRDQGLSDVHIWSTTVGSGSGGRIYKFNFMGKGKYNSINYELSYQTDPVMSNRERQEGIIKTIKSGLLPFMINNSGFNDVDIVYKTNKIIGNESIKKDPWNYWVIEMGGDFDLEKEQSRNELTIEAELEINHTSENWRVRNDLEYEFETEELSDGDYSFNSALSNILYEASVVRSISNHWSAGIFTSIWSNSKNNTRFGRRLAFAVEYNYFPYNQSHKKELSFAYRIGPELLDYYNPTIYDVTSDRLVSNELTVLFRLEKSWGDLDLVLKGSNYLNDIKKNRLELESDVQVRIVKGLSLKIGAEYKVIHDQIYLPKGDIALEELLLRRKAIETSYIFNLNIGITYTFGSIYNTIVNTRL
mgnify:CR=1 FL=1